MFGEFKVGSKVVCIDDKFEDDPKLPFKVSEIKKPVKGVVYTIRGFTEDERGFGLRLKEISNEEYHYGPSRGAEEPGFMVNRFVPFDKFNQLSDCYNEKPV